MILSSTYTIPQDKIRLKPQYAKTRARVDLQEYESHQSDSSSKFALVQLSRHAASCGLSMESGGSAVLLLGHVHTPAPTAST